jgi:hypothetical protein
VGEVHQPKDWEEEDEVGVKEYGRGSGSGW